MFENRDCAHCLFGRHYVNTWGPDGQNRDERGFIQCQKTGKNLREEEGSKNSCWRFARRKDFPSKEEQLRNLWRNRLGRRSEKMSLISLVALVLSITSLAISLNLVQLIKQWLGIG